MSSTTSNTPANKNGKHQQFFKVATAECPDVDYFETLFLAKLFCDRHQLSYGYIMLCDKDKNEIGDWGDYEEEEEESDDEEDRCASCGTTCLDHTSNKGRGSESPCKECGEYRCKYCPCECGENRCNRCKYFPCKCNDDIYK